MSWDKKTKQNIEIKRYSPDITLGLTNEIVTERKALGLYNHTKKKYSKSYLSIFIGNFCTFFNLLGVLVATALLLIKAPISNFFFVLIYAANIFIGLVQEIRAKKSIDKLSILANKTTKVIRNGQIFEINSTDIVLDDLFILELGNQVPTDCQIVEGEFEVNESLLTGESVAIKKGVGDTLFAGSFITSGTGKVQAIKVGKDNYVETLSAKAKKYKKPHSELMNSLNFFIKSIGIIIIPIAILLFLKSKVIFNTSIIEAISSTSTVVIGLIPSGMFLLTSMALAVGVIKLARHNTLVQDLYSLEMLARVDTLCFDKTGTITDGRMTINQVIELTENPKYSTADVISSMLSCLKDNNQTAIALYNHFGHKSIMQAEKVLSFNSARKLSAVTFTDEGTYAFGAPEFVLSKEAYSYIEAQINQYASLGLRVLLLAHSNSPIVEDSAPNDFTPLSIILITDSIREDAVETVNWFKANNVQIKVISGDNPVTVAEVSRRVGIEGADKYISLEGLTDNEVFDIADKYTVFGRVSPEQKAILVKALKTAGHTTAMTGDGVNDILALKEADCAISVASGSESARNVSHLVLMDNNFNSMPKIVYEGRRVINNVQSSSTLFLMKTMFTFLFALFTLIIPTIRSYPFQPSNMIILEVFVIGFPSFFLSLQANDSLVKGRFITKVLAKSLPNALMMFISVLLIWFFKLGLSIEIDEKTYITMSVFVLNFAGLVSLYNICKPLNIYRGVLFSLSLFAIMIVTIIAVFVGIQELLGLSMMSPISKFWPLILIVTSVVLLDIVITPAIEKVCSKISFERLTKQFKKKQHH